MYVCIKWCEGIASEAIVREMEEDTDAAKNEQNLKIDSLVD